MKSKRYYVNQINKEYEKKAKDRGVKLNSNAYRKMEGFAWSRFCKEHNGPVGLNDMFKFEYSDAMIDLVPNKINLFTRIKSDKEFTGGVLKFPVFEEEE